MEALYEDVTQAQRAKAEMLKRQIEKRAGMSRKEIEDFHRKICVKCEYAELTPMKRVFRACDYILITGKIRPCATGDCVKEGVFSQRSRSKGRRESYDDKWNRKGEGGLSW